MDVESANLVPDPEESPADNEDANSPSEKAANIDEEDEEEEDEDAAAAEKEMQGFIVSDEENNDEVDDGEEDEDDDDDRLDAEDLELINENLQQQEEERKPKSGFRRLKRAAHSSDDEEPDPTSKRSGLFEGVDEEEEEEEVNEYAVVDEEWASSMGADPSTYSTGLSAAQQSQLRDIFGPDLPTLMDVLSGRRPKCLDKDELSSAHAGGGTDPYGDNDMAEETALPLPKKPEMSEEDLAREFIRKIDEPERLVERYKHRPKPVSEDIIKAEASWMVEKFKNYAKNCPLPFMKMQWTKQRPDWLKPTLQRSPLYPTYPLCDLFDEPAQRKRYDEIFKQSADVSEELQNPGEYFFPKTKSIEEDIREKVEMTLKMLLNDRVEVPFIVTHHAHLIFPPLTVEAVWKIWDWDVQWWRIAEIKRGLEAELSRVPNVSPSLQEMLQESTDDFVLGDFRHYIQAQVKPLPAAPTEPTASNGDTRRKPIKRTRISAPSDGLYQKYFLESGLRDKWAPYIMTPEAFLSVLREKDANLVDGGNDADMDVDLEDEECEVSTSAAPDPPPFLRDQQSAADDGSTALNAWLKEIASRAAFQCPDKLYEGIVRFEGRMLALYPGFKQLVRTWVWDKLAISTVTTSKAERQVDPAKPPWLPSRLFKMPLKALWSERENPIPVNDPKLYEAATMTDPAWARERWRLEMALELQSGRFREFGLEIQKLSKQEMLEFVIHPIATSDPAPWRQTASGDEVRWKRGKLKRLNNQSSRHQDGNNGSSGSWVQEYSQFEASDREDENNISDLVRQLSRFYCPNRPGCPPVWRKFLNSILHTAIVKEALPVIRKEVRQKLFQISEEYVLERCQQQLTWRLAEGVERHPFAAADDAQQPSWPDFAALVDQDDDADDDDILPDSEDIASFNYSQDDTKTSFDPHTPLTHFPIVASVIVERDADAPPNKAKVHLTIANRQGILTDYYCFDSLIEYLATHGDEVKLAKEDAMRFEKLVLNKRSRPNILCLGANGLSCREMMGYLEHLQTRIRVLRNRWQLRFISLEVAHLFAQSDMCPNDVKDQHGLFCAQGLSAARFAQDPLAEYCGLWRSASEMKSNYLLALRLHPLQSEIPREVLEHSLLNILVRVVNDVGVYINRLRTAKHLRPLLQFVAGFGPIKAKSFLARFHSVVLERQYLLDADQQGDDEYVSCIGKKVYENCASFVRIRGGEQFGMDRGVEESDPLDDSRIHPIESANQAKKMCRDAQEELVADPGDDRAFVDATFKHPEALEELDLEAYAVILDKQGRPRMLPILEFIKREVESPFKDPRCPFIKPAAEEIFYRVTCEDPVTFHEGSEVHVRRVVARQGDQLERKWILEPGQMEAVFRDETRDVANDGFMRARIYRIDFEGLEVEVCSTPSYIEEILKRTLRLDDLDMLKYSPLIYDDIDAAIHLKRKKLDVSASDMPKQRRIAHPLFRSVPHAKLLENMRSNGQVGQAYVRSSETRDNNLLLYFQTNIKPFKFKNLHIQENDTYDSSGVGTELTLIGEKFNALDEIIGSFCHPYKGFLNDVLRHEKFHSLMSPEDLATKLTAQAQRDFRSIQWGIALDPNNIAKEPSERFVIVAVCNGSRGQPKIIKDSLYVTHRGYRLWLRTDKNIWNLLNWWKTEGFSNRQQYWNEYQRSKSNGPNAPN